MITDIEMREMIAEAVGFDVWKVQVIWNIKRDRIGIYLPNCGRLVIDRPQSVSDEDFIETVKAAVLERKCAEISGDYVDDSPWTGVKVSSAVTFAQTAIFVDEAETY
jgi:hypothetical protein